MSSQQDKNFLEDSVKEEVLFSQEPKLPERGENFQLYLLEQYKLCVEMADRISTRRSQANTFYISLLSAMLAILSLVIERKLYSGSQSTLLLFTSMLGSALCLTWYVNIESYKQLNSMKYQVINEMEKQLPFPCYTREWDILKADRIRKKKYIRLTDVEKIVPLIFAIPYFGLFLHSFLGVLKVIR
jgi:hypothetical protein